MFLEYYYPQNIKDINFSGSNSNGQRQSDEPITAKATTKPKKTAKEKRVYQAKKNEEKGEKEKTAPLPKIMLRVWADAQTGIDGMVADERKANRQCTKCTLKNHG